jgi:hypothetical protein
MSKDKEMKKLSSILKIATVLYSLIISVFFYFGESSQKRMVCEQKINQETLAYTRAGSQIGAELLKCGREGICDTDFTSQYYSLDSLHKEILSTCKSFGCTKNYIDNINKYKKEIKDTITDHSRYLDFFANFAPLNRSISLQKFTENFCNNWSTKYLVIICLILFSLVLPIAVIVTEKKEEEEKEEKSQI